MDNKEFASYLGSIFQNGLVMVSVGLGYELGFYKVLTTATEPFSEEGLAAKLNFKERYGT